MKNTHQKVMSLIDLAIIPICDNLKYPPSISIVYGTPPLATITFHESDIVVLGAYFGTQDWETECVHGEENWVRRLEEIEIRIRKPDSGKWPDVFAQPKA